MTTPAHLPQLIGGISARERSTENDINPSDTSEVVARWERGDADDARRAVEAAATALPAWSSTTPQHRAEILLTASREIDARADELGRLLAREEGKTLLEATGEVRRAARILEFHAGQAVRLTGTVVESVRPGVEISVTHGPVGVVTAITPWNFPIAIPAWKIAPALAYGNTVVLKPSETVPASAWHLVDVLHRAGVPRGALNLVLGFGQDVGEVLTGSSEVDAVSFTGSETTGRAVLRSATEGGARVQLEMGGKNPLVVLDDADLDLAVALALEGSFGSSGQRCTASSRLVVTSGVHDEFVDRLRARLSTWSVGHALASDTDMGPVVDARQLQKDEAAIARAAADGMTVLGGRRLERATEGFFLEPALILGSSNHDHINRNEVFGPVAAVIRVESYDEAVAVANDTPYGLSAGIITRSLAAATDFRRRSTAGMTMVNLSTAGVDFHVPFGGSGSSSYGPREQGAHAREFFTESRTSYVCAGPVA